MKKNLLTRACALAAMTVMAIGADAQTISWTKNDLITSGGLNGKTFGTSFVLTCTDSKSKQSIDTNSASFGTSDAYEKFDGGRLKTGGSSSSNNCLTLTIPSTGTLSVYVRSSKSSDTVRSLVLTQNSEELYNAVVKDADAVTVSETKVYPVISVSVRKGTVDVTYPTGALNFYAFKFTASPYILTTSDTEFYSLYLPFAATIPSGITAYRGNGNVENGVLSLTEITDVIPAEEAVLVKSNGNGTYEFESSSTEGTKSDTNPLLGVLADTPLTDLAKEGYTLLTLGTLNNEVGFRLPNSSDTQLGANKAYLLVGESSTTPAKGVSIVIGDETTDISEVVSSTATEDAPAYNLAGQRVSGNAKGLLIKNGKKYVK